MKVLAMIYDSSLGTFNWYLALNEAHAIKAFGNYLLQQETMYKTFKPQDYELRITAELNESKKEAEGKDQGAMEQYLNNIVIITGEKMWAKLIEAAKEIKDIKYNEEATK